MYISFEPLELRKIFCRDDGTKGVCKLDDLSPYGYNFSICRKDKSVLMKPCHLGYMDDQIQF